jgi:hypothetical protein
MPWGNYDEMTRWRFRKCCSSITLVEHISQFDVISIQVSVSYKGEAVSCTSKLLTKLSVFKYNLISFRKLCTTYTYTHTVNTYTHIQIHTHTHMQDNIYITISPLSLCARLLTQRRT